MNAIDLIGVMDVVNRTDNKAAEQSAAEELRDKIGTTSAVAEAPMATYDEMHQLHAVERLIERHWTPAAGVITTPAAAMWVVENCLHNHIPGSRNAWDLEQKGFLVPGEAWRISVYLREILRTLVAKGLKPSGFFDEKLIPAEWR